MAESDLHFVDDSQKVCYGKPGLNYTRIPPVHCQPPSCHTRHRLPCGDVVDGYGHLVQVAPHCGESLGAMGEVVSKAVVDAVKGSLINSQGDNNYRGVMELGMKMVEEKEDTGVQKKRKMNEDDAHKE